MSFDDLKKKCINPDGKTYDGAKLFKLMCDKFYPDNTITQKEIKEMWEKKKRKKK